MKFYQKTKFSSLLGHLIEFFLLIPNCGMKLSKSYRDRKFKPNPNSSRIALIFLYVVTYGFTNILVKLYERRGTEPVVMAKKLILVDFMNTLGIDLWYILQDCSKTIVFYFRFIITIHTFWTVWRTNPTLY